MLQKLKSYYRIREFSAELIGRDRIPISAFKKKQKDSNRKIRNSDNVQIGEWVLAIGYLFTKYNRYCRDY
jgi:S1-C subfamily serine protease